MTQSEAGSFRYAVRPITFAVERTSPTKNSTNGPPLRLTDLESRVSVDARAMRSQAIRDVASENVAASGLDAATSRWVFARMCAESLDGGRAAILRPERRRRLKAAAVDLGLRPFEAALVIALTQDAARSGADAGDAPAPWVLQGATPERAPLRLSEHKPAVRSARVAWQALGAVLMAALMLAGVAAWVLWSD